MLSRTAFPRHEDMLDGERRYVYELMRHLRLLPGYQEREWRREAARIATATNFTRALIESAKVEAGDGWVGSSPTPPVQAWQVSVSMPSDPPASAPARRTRARGRPEGVLVNARAFRHVRTEVGLNQQEFAERIGISWSTVQRGEKGERLSRKTLADVVEYAGKVLGRRFTIDDLILTDRS